MIGKSKILNEEGLHMRPSSKVVTLVEKFNGTVFFYYNNIKADAKNILELMFLSLCKNDEFEIEIISNLSDSLLAKEEEKNLYEKLVYLIEVQKFGEI